METSETNFARLQGIGVSDGVGVSGSGVSEGSGVSVGTVLGSGVSVAINGSGEVGLNLPLRQRPFQRLMHQ